jgi:phosphatidylglycerophosphate synthase
LKAGVWSYKNIPNALSLLRGLLALPFILIIHDIFVHGCPGNLFLLLLFAVIILSDLADGSLARKLRCTSSTGAALDIVSDGVYTFLSLAAFAYFRVIPPWFILVMAFKLTEFIVTSKVIQNKQKSGGPVFFDRIGRASVSMVMLLPGIFVFRCIIADYRTVMTGAVYLITALLGLSSFGRISRVLKSL